jgi:CMP-N-acetylneuraminic acid synthetase
MRHNSERVPGKNYRLFAGKALFHYIVESLLTCTRISQVVINTDSPIIKEDVAKQYPQVTLIDRPKHLRAGTVAMNDVLLYDVKRVRADFYLQTHSTNPLLRTETISRAIDFFLENYPNYNSLFSVTRVNTRLWDQSGNPINHDPRVLLRTQDLPPIYEENSCLYIFSRKTILEQQNRIGKRPFMFEIDPVEACDIDEELDFQIAESLYKNMIRKGNKHYGEESFSYSTLHAT